jgi:hypothetical protein
LPGRTFYRKDICLKGHLPSEIFDRIRANVPSGKCLRTSVTLGKCCSGQISLLGNVLPGECPFRQISFRANFLPEKCPSRQMLLRANICEKMALWANVSVGKCLRANVLPGKYLSGQMSLHANVLSTKAYLTKIAENASIFGKNFVIIFLTDNF